MTDKIESMSKGVEKVSDRIHTIEFDNQNLLKSYFSLEPEPGFTIGFPGRETAFTLRVHTVSPPGTWVGKPG